VLGLLDPGVSSAVAKKEKVMHNSRTGIVIGIESIDTVHSINRNGDESSRMIDLRLHVSLL